MPVGPGEQGAHRHYELHVERLGQLDDRLTEGAPPEVRLGSRQEDGPSVTGYLQARFRRREHVLGPFDLARHPVNQLDLGPCSLEIEELLAVKAAETLRLPRACQGPDGYARGVCSVVPAREAGDENGPLQLGLMFDVDVSNIHGASLPRGNGRSDGASLYTKEHSRPRACPRRRRYSCSGISRAPKRARWGVWIWQSRSPYPRSCSRPTR
jgi:hypothetical protein